MNRCAWLMQMGAALARMVHRPGSGTSLPIVFAMVKRYRACCARQCSLLVITLSGSSPKTIRESAQPVCLRSCQLPCEISGRQHQNLQSKFSTKRTDADTIGAVETGAARPPYVWFQERVFSVRKCLPASTARLYSG